MLTGFIQKQLQKAGFEITRINKPKRWPVDFEDWHQSIIEKVQPFTMTSRERLYGLLEAVKYIESNQIDGHLVECGVWRGGSMLAAAETLTRFKNQERELFLYDTFEGMPPPGAADVSYTDQKADQLLQQDQNKEESLIWAYSTLETVQKTMNLSTYPQNKIHYIKGKVENTIPENLPDKIALLRLDTDWYESTRHELIHLFPRLVKGGVLIIDDYGFWKGARQAVDEYFAENKIQILLTRMDDTGRMAIKQ